MPDTKESLLFDIKSELDTASCSSELKIEHNLIDNVISKTERDTESCVDKITIEDISTNIKNANAEAGFESSNTDIVKVEFQNEYLLVNIKQEEIHIKDEDEITSTLLNHDNQDVDDNASSVDFQKPNQKCLSSDKAVRKTLFICKLCGCNGTNKHYLKEHMRIHTGEQPFTCKSCDYKSAHKANLTAHMRMHTKEEPFACRLCDYKSAQKYSLTAHMTIHTGENLFSCKLCDYKTTYLSRFIQHRRSHTKENLFTCTLCDHKSASISHLVVHMKSHF